jgi:hypothetical protein
VVVGEEVVDGLLVAQVLNQDGQRLQHLHGHIATPVAALLQNPVEVGQQVLGEEVLHHGGVVLVAPV